MLTYTRAHVERKLQIPSSNLQRSAKQQIPILKRWLHSGRAVVYAATMMNALTFTKSQKREIRRLAGIAYEREMSAAAAALEEEFKRWRRGELDVFALNEQIHKFHNGISRDLYKQYAMGDPDCAVALAVRRGVLTDQEVPAEIMSGIGGMVEFFKEYAADK
jgi:hypothetical protein